ncbi:Putative cytoplasmic protein [Burkholderia humptydooensis MSMB43]|uniref:Cytoplasmic protein n=1 Tax=Burkholderia humptydooensis MSMB43 TaxID=441157 RepID=A0ABN0FXJ4_9BURK|nr:Putative cytoplasmic protein [Burkholderia humptydooensis MSMB43]
MTKLSAIPFALRTSDRCRDRLQADFPRECQRLVGNVAGTVVAQPLDFTVSLKDPYILDFLGLNDHYLECDLEDAILREMGQLLLELGAGFMFVVRQKRLPIDDDDFYLDLLFYNRKLKRLVAIELKLGSFKASIRVRWNCTCAGSRSTNWNRVKRRRSVSSSAPGRSKSRSNCLNSAKAVSTSPASTRDAAGEAAPIDRGRTCQARRQAGIAMMGIALSNIDSVSKPASAEREIRRCRSDGASANSSQRTCLKHSPYRRAKQRCQHEVPIAQGARRVRWRSSRAFDSDRLGGLRDGFKKSPRGW